MFSYLTRVMYNRRGKMDPLWNSLIVGGVEADGTPFLGTVGMIGTHYTDRWVGLGALCSCRRAAAMGVVWFGANGGGQAAAAAVCKARSQPAEGF